MVTTVHTKPNFRALFTVQLVIFSTEHLELVTREVYLPLISSHVPMHGGVSGDKLMDLMHRLVGAVQVTRGFWLVFKFPTDKYTATYVYMYTTTVMGRWYCRCPPLKYWQRQQ